MRPTPRGSLLVVLSLCLFMAGTAGANPLLYYDFETDSGTSITNLGSLSTAGTLAGPDATVAGPAGGFTSGTARTFDGSTTVINSNLDAVALGVHLSANYTMAAWLRPLSTSDDNMVFGQTGGSWLHNGTRNNNYHQGHYGNDLTGGTVNAIPLGDWRHVVWRYRDGEEQIFVNGVSVIGPAARGQLNNMGNVLIGRAGDASRSFEGDLDDLVIYQDALTPRQIQHLAGGGNPLAIPVTLAPVPDGTKWETVVIRDGANNLGAAIQDVEDWWTSGIGTNVTGPVYDDVVNYEDPEQGGGTQRHPPRAPFPGDLPGVAENNFAVGARGYLEIEQDDEYTFLVYGDDGSRLRILGTSGWATSGIASAIADGMQINGCCADGLGTAFLTTGSYPIELIWNEIGGGAYVEVWAARGVYTSFDSSTFSLLGSQGVDAVGMRVIPEPASLTLLGLGGLALLRRRRR